MPKAVGLLSGGLDSATAMAVMRSQGFDLYALSIDYGQRHRVELERATGVAKHLQVVEHRVVKVDLRAIGGSALTDKIDVPKNEESSGIPVTYVPARNTIFLSVALGWAETLGVSDLVIGANVLDYSGYPDCRPEFLAAFETVANLGTKAGALGARFKVHAPLLRMTKAEIIHTGMSLGLDYSLTLSCYDPDAAGRACGGCDSCRLRKKGFLEAGVPDSTLYRS